jgi:crossover junction endodeoxyribonuclease RusA
MTDPALAALQGLAGLAAVEEQRRQSLAIRVYGTAAPQGSKRHVGRGIMVESSKRLKPWRANVTAVAAEAWDGRPPLEGPVALTVIVSFARPASHYGTGRNTLVLKESAPSCPIGHQYGDLDKLLRGVIDGITDAGVWRDDKQVVAFPGSEKVFAARETAPNTYIRVEALP